MKAEESLEAKVVRSIENVLKMTASLTFQMLMEMPKASACG